MRKIDTLIRDLILYYGNENKNFKDKETEILENENIKLDTVREKAGLIYLNYILDKNKHQIIITENIIEAEKIKECFEEYNLDIPIFRQKEYRDFDVETESKELYISRMNIIREFEREEIPILIIPIDTCIQGMIDPNSLFKNVINKKVGDELDIVRFINTLISFGYVRRNKTEDIGHFSVKGEIIDIALNETIGVRIETSFDIIEKIRYFSLFSQRSIKEKKEIDIYPAFENILLNNINIESLKEKIFNLKTKDNYIEINSDIEKINENNFFSIYEKYLDLFFAKNTFFIDYLDYFSDKFEKYGAKITVLIDNPKKIEKRIDSILEDLKINLNLYIDKKRVVPFYLKEETIDRIVEIKNKFGLLKNNNKENNKFKLRRIIDKSYLSESVNSKGINKLSESYFLKEIEEIDLGKDIYTFSDNIEKLYNKNENRIILYSNKVEELKNIFREKNIPLFIVEDDDFKSTTQQLKNAEISIDYGNKEFLDDKGKSEKKTHEKTKKIISLLSEKENYVFLFPSNMQKCLKILPFNIILAGYEEKKKNKKGNFQNKLFKDSTEIIFEELEIGDFIVHRNIGIGKYQGMKLIEVAGKKKDYFMIEYAGGDLLYVPVENSETIRKYIGGGIDSLKLSKLGTKDFEKTKERVKSHLREVAKELVILYKEREKIKGFPFLKDTKWQKKFENSFKYDETNDQLKCSSEIKLDMEKEKPMDRLLCGDVGFGKTEVAMRAAFKAVLSGKQVAYLAPTTILVKQQYEEFTKRMKEFPVDIDYLSRERTEKEVNDIKRRLKSGEIDIIIGTHKLLGKDIQFKDLGFLIVDEEHRFGVKDKEKIKFIKKQIDVLSMSATPIPRTLYMSISGIRDISVLYDPPQNRKSIQTYLLEYDTNLIKEIILKEIGRHGQVFFIHNRVENIDFVTNELCKMFPDLSIKYAHGKMSAKEVSKILEEFKYGKIDILVTTTILESGIDIQNANTIIITEADKFGLAQLYQLRGRVGRGDRKAYCYLLFKKNKVLGEKAEKRLNAIKDFTELGSGYKIAMRDLEIRGGGSVIGEIQHGQIEKVGYDLYIKLLNDVMLEMENKESIQESDIRIDLNINKYIPEEYIEKEDDRIEVYKSIAKIKSEQEIEIIKEEIIDRFGKIPKEVDILFEMARIKNMMREKKIERISQKGGVITYYYLPEFTGKNIQEVLRRYSQLVRIIPKDKKITQIILESEDKKIVEEIQKFLKYI